jgi:hypothetical protein
MRWSLLSIATALVTLAAPPGTAQAPSPAAASPPALVVILVVDQMRADYVDRFAGEWTAGLKRLVRDGAWFSRAEYPYLATVTCPGHATIASGAFPRTHGVVQNAWWDRESRKQVSCTADPRAMDIGYGVPVTGGDSPFRLEIPTLTDRLRAARDAHVVSLSLKDRSAVMLAGHGADAVTWFTESPDGWMTSSVYSTERVPAVQKFLDANPMTADYGKTWTRLLPAARYHGRDDGLGETPPTGWTATFPHRLSGTGPHADGSFVAQWERSPFADAYLGRFAAALAESLQLGRHHGTDVLAVSFSTPDLVGHAFGPRSQEVEDEYAQLDRTIGDLLGRLDALVGTGTYVVALSADHGVAEMPEQQRAAGKDAGRLNSGRIRDQIESILVPALGAGKHVAQVNGNDVYFEPGVYTTLQSSAPTLDAVIAAIAAGPGVDKVFRAEQVRDGARSSDPLLRAAALSYFPGRSGDLLLVPKPGWMFASSGTTHGTASADDRRVPIVFFGRGVKPGVYPGAATPADIAPTLAALCGISLPAAEGHALGAALKR